MVRVSVEAEIEKSTKYLTDYEKSVIPKAINRALNRTGTNVRTTVNRHISKESGLKVGKIKERTTLTKSTVHRPIIEIRALRSDTNIIEFVTPGRKKVGGFKNKAGVTANPWRNRQEFAGTFIVVGRYSGKLIVVKRKRSAGRGKGWSTSVYGPSIHKEFARPAALSLFRQTAIERFKVNWDADLKYYLSRLKQ